MLDYQIVAINAVREYARARNNEHLTSLKKICTPLHAF